MAITAYADQDDVEFVLGQYGLRVRVSDSGDGAPETGWVANGLEVGAVTINRLLFTRYAMATLQAATWVKWVNAYLAAEVFCRRRGNGVPASLVEVCDEYRIQLKEIKDGALLPADTGLAAPVSDHSPAHSNLEIDSRYHRRKVRTVRDTSTGDPPGDGAKRNETLDFPGYWP